MEKQHPIGDLMTTTMQKIREIADVNTIIGQPIKAGEITIIPISKLTVGFASGGVDFDGYMKALEDIGYTGFLTIEREVGENPAADIALAVEFLNRYR